MRRALHGDIAMLPETTAVHRRRPQALFVYKAIALLQGHRGSTKFWLAQGPGHATAWEAILDLFPGDLMREAITGIWADQDLREIAKIPGPAGRAALRDLIAQHPGLQ